MSITESSIRIRNKNQHRLLEGVQRAQGGGQVKGPKPDGILRKFIGRREWAAKNSVVWTDKSKGPNIGLVLHDKLFMLTPETVDLLVQSLLEARVPRTP